MSRSNPTSSIPNPSHCTIEWSGKDGHFYYYDKELQKDIVIKEPFSFIVLDQLVSIAGFSDRLQCGFYSNEVHDTTKELLHVRSQKGNFEEAGLYKDLKPKLIVEGAKYCKNIYVATNIGGSLVIAKMKLVGAAFSEWYDFEKMNKEKVYAAGITCKKAIEKKKGTNTYQCPVFQLKDLTEATEQAAIELDIILQKYFKVKSASSHITEASEAIGESAQNPVDASLSALDQASQINPADDGVDDLPF
mgnify:CR=1 FL=1